MFGSLAGLSTLVNLYFLVSMQQDLAFLALTANMVIGLLVPLYIFTDLYKEFFTGVMPVNHLLPVRTSSLFAVKSAVFILGSMAVWSTTLLEVFLNPSGLYQMRIEQSSSPAPGILYLVLSRLLSLPAGDQQCAGHAAGRQRRSPAAERAEV